ncbi:MAG TPA: hypothetical protein VHQ65_03315 [Thermoanaerobaculia bacterium]|nr:hypothetical protein [Thermoanaerobaculia bacterium]
MSAPETPDDRASEGGGTQSAGADPRRDAGLEVLRPAHTRSSHRDDGDAVPFSAVLDAELAAIAEGRRLRFDLEETPELEGDTPEARAQDARLAALAFSGGGIRSATFNLGVAQGLARLGLLRRFDYLSINSGGGYIGSWLLAWIRRAGLAEVERELRTDACRDDQDRDGSAGTTSSRRSPGSPEAEPVSFLRRFSNYLTPRMGAFSADTWTMVTTYLRNLLLNQAVLVLALGAMILLPRLLLLVSSELHPIIDAAAVEAAVATEGAAESPAVSTEGATDALTVSTAPSTEEKPFPWASLLASIAALAIALIFLGRNQVALLAVDGGRQKPFPWFASQDKVQWTVVLPLFVSAWMGALWMWFAHLTETDFHANPEVWAGLAAGLYGGLWLAGLMVHGIATAVRGHAGEPSDPRMRKLWTAVLLSAIPSGALGGLLLWLVAIASASVADTFASLGYGGSEHTMHLLHVNAWMVPGVVLVFILTAFVHTGLMGRAFPEALRQWWSRLGAWLLIWALSWVGLVLVAFFGPLALVILGTEIAAALGSGWLLSTLGGVLVGRRASREAEPPSWWRRAVVAVAPQIFIVGLLALIALGVHVLLDPPADSDAVAAVCPEGELWMEGDEVGGASSSRRQRIRNIVRCHAAHNAAGTTWAPVLTYLAILGFGAVGLSARVDINEFSMHLFYRNRLIRAYLGASNRRRRPNPFTGFDPSDDLPLASLEPGYVPQRGPATERPYDGPYPLLNIALNLVAGKELAWQERKAASFVFSPLHTGFDARRAHTETGTAPDSTRQLSAHAFRPTQHYQETTEGISLGTAMAISGAAASPNMGSGSTPAMAFLLTVFNVRLGWWLGNPRHRGTWDRMGPRVGLWALLAELFGSTDDESTYVYLSDGGHFDNLALYEMVRRRCRFIVLSDAGADPKVTFDDLGNAIRKCCTDFGIEVDLDVARFRPDGELRFAEWHCAVGKIRYDKVDPEAAPGILVYLKASLTGDEPPDVLNYAAEHPEFPHESTADQWFGEAQFESYRKLGEHVVMSVLQRAADDPAALNPETLFVRLQETWFPPSAAPAGAFSGLAQRLTGLLDRLAGDPNLAFLAPQLYPEWPSLMAGAGVVARAADGVPDREPGQRLWLPDRPEELSAGFFYCQSLIQLMQDVYLDLRLEEEYDHPDNRGWLNVFKHWSWPGMVRATWAVTASTCGARFQNFCHRRLGLELGEVEAEVYPLAGVDVPGLTRRLEAENRVNFLEGSLVRELVAATPGLADRLLVLRLVVADPSAMHGDEAERLAFTFGIALVAGTDLVYLRVQDHLRKMGLGRRALRRLISGHQVRGVRPLARDRMPEYSRHRASERRRDKLRELFRSVINEVGAE